MSDSLQDFESMFDPTILGRGRDYFHQGCVLEIEEIEQGEYRAAVEGSEVYDVSVSLDKGQNVLDISCDCPYDWDAHCKHQAAVLFALRKQLMRNGADPARKQPPLLDDLRDILYRKTKEALIDMLVSIVRENPSLGKRMLCQLKEESTP